jgi:hypothetical protein
LQPVTGWAPSSIICNFDVICPAFRVFVAKEIRTEGFSFPGTCKKHKDLATFIELCYVCGGVYAMLERY